MVTDGTVPADVNARAVRLTAELTMIPVGRDLLAQLDPAAVGDDRIPAGWVMTQPARRISAGRLAMYVVSETDAGPDSRKPSPGGTAASSSDRPAPATSPRTRCPATASPRPATAP